MYTPSQTRQWKLFDLRVSRPGRFNLKKKKFTLEKTGEQRYCCTRSLTSALDGGEW